MLGYWYFDNHPSLAKSELRNGKGRKNVQNAPAAQGIALYPIVASELSCEYCEWPLIKNGELKCKRSRHTVRATLGQEKVFCPYCRKPKVLLLDEKNQAVCPRCGSRTLITEKEQEMTKEAVAEKASSKTQELRDWLDREIKTIEGDINTLVWAFEQMKYPTTRSTGYAWRRYGALTSDEREAKMAEDRKKLDELKERLEQLKSARELDVDVDAMEESGFKVDVCKKGMRIIASYEAQLPSPKGPKTCTLVMHLGVGQVIVQIRNYIDEYYSRMDGVSKIEIITGTSYQRKTWSILVGVEPQQGLLIETKFVETSPTSLGEAWRIIR